jgi:hypothetical protein
MVDGFGALGKLLFLIPNTLYETGSTSALFGRRAQRSSASRSSLAKLTGAIGLPVRIGVLPPLRKTPTDYKLFNVFMTQDTKE